MQFDIKTSILYGSIDEDIYMDQPIGFQASNIRHDTTICKRLYLT
jgi:hypothetical protein